MSEPKNTFGYARATKVTSVQQAVTIAAAKAADEHDDELPQVRAGHIRIAANKAAKEFEKAEETKDEAKTAPAPKKPAAAKETAAKATPEPVAPVVTATFAPDSSTIGTPDTAPHDAS